MERVLVKVVWIDAKMWGAEWEDNHHIEEHELPVCISVGWIIKETDDMLLLCQTTSEHFNANFVGIPKPCVKNREVISGQG